MSTTGNYRSCTWQRRGSGGWGAFDLYNGSGAEVLIVDFKTHPVQSVAEAERVAEEYSAQVRVYEEAARLRATGVVRLHFTALDR